MFGVRPVLGEAFSFRSGIRPWQRAALNSLIVAASWACLLHPAAATQVLARLAFSVFTILILWRVQLVFVGAIMRALPPRRIIHRKRESDIPVYSVLVPAYREPTLMPQISAALRGLNWPPQKLDTIVLLEPDDPATLEAARAAKFPPETRLVTIPSDGPKTKPNALNHGLALARGRYVTVFDVEDLPHPDQLRAAQACFDALPQDVICLQAPLIGDNPQGAWLAAQWCLEYAVQFGLLMRSLALYQMPVLIGGTSNHFRKEALYALGGWDAWNVTEDADLGMRMARVGLRCEMVSLPTHEDAPITLPVWLAQRSRWIKGFIQTWWVLMRRPRKTLQQMGAIRFCVMQLTLGGAILAALCHLPLTLLVALALLLPSLELGTFGTSLLLAGLLVSALSDILAPGRWTAHRYLAVLTRPLYWPLHSIAAYRAVWELANKPFFWAKTPHTPRNPDSMSSCSIGSSASASPPP